jgi:O-antigen ligase
VLAEGSTIQWALGERSPVRFAAAALQPVSSPQFAFRRGPILLAGLASVAALILGTAVTINPTDAILIALAAALVPMIALRPAVLLPLLVATVFLGVVAVGGITIGRIIAPIAAFVALAALARGTTSLPLKAPLGWACAFALWALASGFWTVNIGGTVFQLSSLAIAFAYMLAFATLLASEAALRVLLFAISGVALGVGIVAILTAQVRAQGISGDANEFAAIELVALPLVIVLAATVRPGVRRLFAYAVVGVIVLAVFASLSRGGIVTLALIMALVLIVPARMFFHSKRQKAVVLICIVAALFAAYKISGAALAPRIDAVFAGEDATGSGRLNAWKAAWTSIQERPLLGLGYGAFDPSANELMLRTSGVDLSNQRLRPGGLKAHSTYIGLTAELGILGIILFLGLLVSTARLLLRVARTARDREEWFLARCATALAISLAGWCVSSLFLSADTSRTLWIIVGLSLALARLLGSPAEDEHASDRSLGAELLKLRSALAPASGSRG